MLLGGLVTQRAGKSQLRAGEQEDHTDAGHGLYRLQVADVERRLAGVAAVDEHGTPAGQFAQTFLADPVFGELPTKAASNGHAQGLG